MAHCPQEYAETIKNKLELYDASTDKRLLPRGFRTGDNSRRIRYCHKALREALRTRLTPAQRRNIEMHYRDQIRKSDIAGQNHTSCSSVSKSIRAGQRQIQEYVELYMRIYDELEKEFLLDE